MLKQATINLSRNLKQLRAFTSTPEFRLVQFDPNSEGDFRLFKGLMVDNIEFSALQFLIPNLKEELNLQDKRATKIYFDRPDKEEYIKNAYLFMTENNPRTPLGYKKVLNRYGEFIGNSGFAVHELDEDGKAFVLERGTHLDQSLCSSPTSSPRNGVKVFKLIHEDLLRHADSLNKEGIVESNILSENTRSVKSMFNNGLNVGEPINKKPNVDSWAYKVRDYLGRTPQIIDKLNQKIGAR
jgi:hypothetical protein